MTERPILFSGPMIRAILDGTKTQTRRVVTAKVWDQDEDGKRRQYVTTPGVWGDGREMTAAEVTERFRCPYGQPGDRLWVRETCLMQSVAEGPVLDIMYADHEDYDICYPSKGDAFDLGWRVRPSIFMPRWASRITLELTDVRVERVQEISEEDALAEGCFDEKEHDGSLPSEVFRDLWDSINAKRGYGWEVNPWCWVLTFRRVETQHGTPGGK